MVTVIGVIPVPVIGRLSGLVGASVVMVTDADRAPMATGAKVIFQVQTAPMAKVAPQVLVLIGK